MGRSAVSRQGAQRTPGCGSRTARYSSRARGRRRPDSRCGAPRHAGPASRPAPTPRSEQRSTVQHPRRSIRAPWADRFRAQSTSASPSATPLSRTTSASSNSRLPETCRDAARRECPRLVMATTFACLARISSAISIGTAFRPEFDMMMPMSPGLTTYLARIDRASPCSRSELVLTMAPSNIINRRSRMGLTATRPPARKNASSARRCE